MAEFLTFATSRFSSGRRRSSPRFRFAPFGSRTFPSSRGFSPRFPSRFRSRRFSCSLWRGFQNTGGRFFHRRLKSSLSGSFSGHRSDETPYNSAGWPHHTANCSSGYRPGRLFGNRRNFDTFSALFFLCVQIVGHNSNSFSLMIIVSCTSFAEFEIAVAKEKGGR
jgi:hypothetical protein